MTRVPALDGLRAVALLAVVAYHMSLPASGRGWIGVDVFFVLSGFLITSLLLHERQDTGRISLGTFWLRRAARLYPALILTVAGCLLLNLAVGAGTSGKDVVMALTYAMDLARDDGYDGGALGHTWSLAIEEQFYLLWPVAVILLNTRRRLVVATAAALAASLSAALLLSRPFGFFDMFTYSFPGTRIWELLAGCLLAALWTARPRHRGWGIAASLVAVAGFALTAPWPHGQWIGQSALVVVATTALLISVLAGSWPSVPLSWRPLREIGRISYSAYLYHFPIVLEISPRLPLPRLPKSIVVLLLVLGSAWVSTRFVEEPLRRFAVRHTGRATARGTQALTEVRERPENSPISLPDPQDAPAAPGARLTSR